MFREEERKIQEWQNQFDRNLEEYRIQHKKAMESQKKAMDLMSATFEYVGAVLQGTSEQARKHLLNCLEAVQRDEKLRQDNEVEKLVKDIYQNLDNNSEMQKILSRVNILINNPKVPEISINWRIH